MSPKRPLAPATRLPLIQCPMSFIAASPDAIALGMINLLGLLLAA